MSTTTAATGGRKGIESHPFVSVQPNLRFGEPCIGGTRLPAEMIADRYWDLGEHLESELLKPYGITRADVIVCCWYVATYGTRKQKRRWKDWKETVWANTGIAQDSGGARGWWSEHYADVPLPPTHKQSTEPER